MLKFQHGTSFGLEIATNQSINETLVVSGATREGPFTFEWPITSVAQTTTQTFALPDIPIWLSVGDASSGLHANEIYAELYLTINGIRVHLFGSGYITGFGSITWPAIYKEKEDIGMGLPWLQTPSDPGANTNLTLAFSDTAMRVIDGVAFRVTTDANAGTRTVKVGSNAGGDFRYNIISAETQIASLTRDYVFQKNAPGGATSLGTNIVQPLIHDMYLVEGDNFTIILDNKKAGDLIRFIQIWGRRWMTRTTPGA